MVWCVGYLDREQLVTFLGKASKQLLSKTGRVSRHSEPSSFIFVLDNVLEEYEVAETIKGQRLRSIKELEEIFVQAGLVIHRSSGR